MNETLLWRTAAKIASRELRATPGKFLFVVLAVAAGVGALSGVRGFSMAARSMLLRDARKLMAADVMMRLREAPSVEQKAALDALSVQGIVRTTITETISMSATAAAPVPQMVTIKAVDPGVYPFYGTVTLAPAQALAEALRADTVAASDDLLQRLKTGVGQTLRLGGKDFRIVAALITEQDRLSGNPMAGARILMSRDALERTGLIGPGSRAQNRLLFRLTPSTGVEDVKNRLQKAFPGAQIIDYRETDPGITRGLDSSTVFLSLVSLIALIVGSLGVAMAMHSHMQQKMDTIAIMKSIGARSGQIMRIYLLETVWLGLAGGVLGIALGAAVQRAFPVLIQRFFDQRPDIVWSWAFVAQGMAAGLASTVLFTLPALLRVRRVRPVLVLRREMEETSSVSGFPARAKSAAAIGVPLLLAFGLIAVWIGNSWEIGGYFTGGLLVSLLALSAVAWLLLRSLRWFLRAAPWKLPPTLRHGIANLYRPGNQAQPVLVSLGVGVMFTLTVFLVQRSIVGDIVSKAPPGTPNVFFVDVRAGQFQGLTALVEKHAGVDGKMELAPSIAVRLTALNGVAVESNPNEEVKRRFARPVPATFSEAKPSRAEVLRGAWWTSGSMEDQVAVADRLARQLSVEPGGVLDFTAGGRQIHARIASVFRTGPSVGARYELVFTPKALEGVPATWNGGLRVRSASVASLQRVAYETYPTVTVINMADMLEIVQGVVDQIALVIRFLSGFAILAGVVILASSVAGTRFRRIREVVILKTLGATRGRVAGIFSVEFLILGTVAGVMGGLLGSAFASLLMKRLLDTYVAFDWIAAAVTVLASALIANGAGWLASFRILGKKPLEVLRGE